jgi:hypothetical protein
MPLFRRFPFFGLQPPPARSSDLSEVWLVGRHEGKDHRNTSALL